MILCIAKLPLAFFIVGAGLSSAAGEIDLTVRDVETGYAVRATVVIQNVENGESAPEEFTTDEFGRLGLSLRPGRYIVSVSASGYRPQRTRYEVAEDAGVRIRASLTPLEPPMEYRPDVFDPKLRGGFNLIHGFVVDVNTGRPLAGVTVRTLTTDVETRTDSRGYFELYAPSDRRGGPNVEPPTEDLMIRLPGYKTQIMRNFWIPDGMDTSFKIDLEPGAGTIERDLTHKMKRLDTSPR